MDAIRFDRDDEGIVTLTIDMPGQSANTMNPAFRAALEVAVERLVAERDRIKGVVLTSAKKTFFAGGDLNHLLAARREDAAAMFERASAMKRLLRRLETFGPPVVAAINGTALGGGFELCLACHARVVLDGPGVLLGLPEATLGLLPGAGGVVRLVRMLGVEAAMTLIVDGLTFAPARALELKLVDGLAPDLGALLAQARAWIAANPSARQPWDRKGFQLPGATAHAVAPLSVLRSAPLALMKKHRGLYPAPEAAMSAVVECAAVDFETASRIESRYLVHLATHPVSKNLITTFFFQMNEVKNGKGRPEGLPASSVRKLGVLGAGLMGCGIAQVAAARGIPVVLKDVSDEAATKGKARIDKLLTLGVDKGRLTPAQRERTLAAITPTGDAAALAGCDLIIESVFEKRDVKAAATREAQAFVADGGFLASNTSTLPISGLAEAVDRPEDFIGIHFFSPVDRMPLVEIIKGARTSAQTLARAHDFVMQLRKTPIVVNDSRGFYTSRVFGTYTREGAAMLGEGVEAARIENAAMAVGLPVGPLAVMDETSMALAWSVRQQTIADLTAEGRPIPQHPGWDVIRRMAVELGRPGRAGGGGFYDYPDGAPKRLWAGLVQQFPHGAAQPPDADLRDRLLYIQALESVRCLEEGVIEAARDANIGSVLGIGFPRWTGGTLQFINSVGLPAFVARARELAARYGERFAPPARLVAMSAQNERFV